MTSKQSHTLIAALSAFLGALAVALAGPEPVEVVPCPVCAECPVVPVVSVPSEPTEPEPTEPLPQAE